ncbi:hypothetical protein D9758_012815 [Tetrapyrgos nigripes]|uniref:Uncharacterized protein n=1 Tax=Tetrapyrgos nigripes TaxID=182062 RepID=A0A8H5D073_9AGAR|nr:hypothetical protein D9758_012815 [Tetrapyrgos nigripes]
MNVGQSHQDHEHIQRQYPVCIVGAGPTGLAAAHALEAKNYSVVVFDKQPEVGGKSQAYNDGDQGSLFHAMGALLISNASYIDTLPIVEAAGVPFLPALSVTSGWIYPPVLANTSVINVTRTPNPSPAQINLIESEFSRYTDLRSKIFEPYGAMRYTNGIPGDLTIPIGQWLSQNGFQVLPIVINAGLSLAGYGDIEHTPTIYALQYLSPDILAFFANLGPVNFVDFHAVMSHYASSIRGRIHTNTAVTKIDRSGPVPVLTYVSRNTESTRLQTQTQKCSHLILAFPPLLEALRSSTLV